MSGESRTINAIVVPVRSDVGGFGKGLDKARKDAEKFEGGVTRRFGVMGKGIGESLKGATGKLQALGATNLGLVSAGLAGVAVAAAAASAAVLAIGAGRIADFGKDALAVGMTTEAFSKLRGVARATGTDLDDLSEFVKGLTAGVHDSIGKTTTAGEAMKALGTSAEALAKMTPDEQIRKLNEGMAKLPDNSARSKAAMLLAGQAGVKMFRMLSMGSKEFKETFDSAPIVTDDDVSEMRKLQISIDKIKDTFLDLSVVVTTKVLPPIQSIADILANVASKFGMAVKSFVPGKLPPVPQAVASMAGGKANPLADMQAAKARLALEGEADRARADVERMQKRYDDQGAKLRANPGHLVSRRKTNGHLRFEQSDQKAVDQHAVNGQELNAAKAKAQQLADAAKSAAGAMTEAMRMNLKLVEQVSGLKQEYRTAIEGSGKDEVHRRVGQIKGLSGDQRKQLVQQGYQAREAGKSSALRDELQESTKLPIEKFAEDMGRIRQMVALGAENGGLSKLQGVRAMAMKTQEAGLAGNQTQFAGALQSNSTEGRSYLLSQTLGKPEDMLQAARAGNAILGQMLQEIQRQGRKPTNSEVLASM